MTMNLRHRHFVPLSAQKTDGSLCQDPCAANNCHDASGLVEANSRSGGHNCTKTARKADLAHHVSQRAERTQSFHHGAKKLDLQDTPFHEPAEGSKGIVSKNLRHDCTFFLDAFAVTGQIWTTNP